MQTITHPSTNRARRRATTLIEINALLLNDATTYRIISHCNKSVN